MSNTVQLTASSARELVSKVAEGSEWKWRDTDISIELPPDTCVEGKRVDLNNLRGIAAELNGVLQRKAILATDYGNVCGADLFVLSDLVGRLISHHEVFYTCVGWGRHDLEPRVVRWSIAGK